MLVPKSRYTRLLQFPREAGMLFSKLFEAKSRCFKLGSKPSSNGILPVKLLAPRMMVCSRLQFPRDGGICPLEMAKEHLAKIIQEVL